MDDGFALVGQLSSLRSKLQEISDETCYPKHGTMSDKLLRMDQECLNVYLQEFDKAVKRKRSSLRLLVDYVKELVKDSTVRGENIHREILEIIHSSKDDEFALVGQLTSLRQKLKVIWDETGDVGDVERTKLLAQMDQQCLDVYVKAFDAAVEYKEDLLSVLLDNTKRLQGRASQLGEEIPGEILLQLEDTTVTTAEKLSTLKAALGKLLNLCSARYIELEDIQYEILKIEHELYGKREKLIVDYSDLSLKKLAEFQDQLHELQEKKHARWQQVLKCRSTVRDLCAVLGRNFLEFVDGELTWYHPISDITVDILNRTISKLEEEKKQRLDDKVINELLS